MNCCWRTIWPMVLDTTFIAVVAVVVVRLFSTLRSLTNGIRMKKWRERICVTCFVDVLIEFCLWYVVISIRSLYEMKTSISLSAINTVCACILLSDFPFDGSILLMYSIREQIFAEIVYRTHFWYFLDTLSSFLWNYAIAFITFSPGKRHNFVTVFEKYGNGCECVSALYKINAIVYRNTLDTDKEKEKEESKWSFLKENKRKTEWEMKY